MTAVPFDYLYGCPVHFRIYRDVGGKPDDRRRTIRR
jgi:hypothetical protein